jgi:hypothetical protein
MTTQRTTYLTPLARCQAALDLREDMNSRGIDNMTDLQVHQAAAALQALLAPLAPTMARR